MNTDRFKFRVWDKRNKRYVEINNDTYLNLYQGCFTEICLAKQTCVWHYSNNNIIEQCTGIKDKNGDLIYEGDVLKDNNNLRNPVSFVDGSFVFTHLRAAVFPLKQEIANKLEVIGNIHDQFREVTKKGDEKVRKCEEWLKQEIEE